MSVTYIFQIQIEPLKDHIIESIYVNDPKHFLRENAGTYGVTFQSNKNWKIELQNNAEKYRCVKEMFHMRV